MQGKFCYWKIQKNWELGENVVEARLWAKKIVLQFLEAKKVVNRLYENVWFGKCTRSLKPSQPMILAAGFDDNLPIFFKASTITTAYRRNGF